MKKLALLLLAALPLLTGCGVSSPEKQAYLICMALDYTDSGDVLLTAQLPQSGQGASSGGAEGYALLATAGRSFAEALHRLETGVPYPLNFSQLRLMIVSQEMAAQIPLESLLRELLQKPLIRASATLAVSVGKASDVLQKQKPDLGMRISKHVDTILTTLHIAGLVPSSTLGDTARAFEENRGDPLLCLCAVNPTKPLSSDAQDKPKSTQEDMPAIALLDEGDTAGSSPMASVNPVEFLGAAVTSQGRVVGVLSGREMQLCAMAMQDGQLRVALEGPQLQVWLPAQLMKHADELRTVIGRLQTLQSDALGFAQAAAGAFVLESEWDRYAFAAKYSQADVYIGVA